MPKTITQARRQLLQEHKRAVRAAGEQSFRQGYSRSEGFDPAPTPRSRHSSVLPYSGPGRVQGGAQDDPSVIVEVGPDGTVTRRKR